MSDTINVNIKLNGQYKFSVIEQDEVVYTTPWCNNTILSSGLVDLYDHDIDSLLYYLDIGGSNSNPGVLGYGLSGVITLSEFNNILRDNIETYNDTISSKTYLTSYTTNKATSGFSINEFAIKKDTSSAAFARNTFITGYDILPGQLLNFEYKLTLNWANNITTAVPFTGNDVSYTYTIPVTSVTYNMPYNKVYNNSNYLMLLGNTYTSDNILTYTLPSIGENFPINFDWGIGQASYSTFKPTEISKGIDNVNRVYSVVSQYSNISCSPYNSLYDNIQSGLLVYNGDMSIPSNKFNITRFAFPLAVYNQSLSCDNFLEVPSSVNRYNNLTLYYSYTWGECRCTLCNCPPTPYGRSTYDYGSTWRTVSDMGSTSPLGGVLEGAENDDAWILVETSNTNKVTTYTGYVSFGVNDCGDIQLDIWYDRDYRDDVLLVTAQVNTDAPITLFSIPSGGQEAGPWLQAKATIPMAGAPLCDNIVTIYVTQGATGTDPSGISTYIRVTGVGASRDTSLI